MELVVSTNGVKHSAKKDVKKNDMEVVMNG